MAKLSVQELVAKNIRKPDTPEKATPSFARVSGTEFAAQTREVPVGAIRPSPYQPRTRLDPDHIESMAESIQSGRLIEPIIIREIGDGIYELISGEHRLEAVKQLNRETILATIRQISDREARLVTLVTNLKRKDIADYEAGKRFKELIDSKEVNSVTEMSRLAGVPRQTVYRCLALANLPEEILVQLEEHPFAIAGTAGDDLRSLVDEGLHDLCVQAVRLVIEGKLKQADIDTWVRSHNKPAAAKGRPEPMFKCAGDRVKGFVVAKGRKITASLSCDKAMSQNDVSKVMEAVEEALRAL